MKFRNLDSKICIGMMSGTSMDGIDACLVKIDGDFSYRILDTYSSEYPVEVSKSLMEAANGRALTFDICCLDFVVGKLFAKCANALINKSKIDKVDFISSHGQTIYHVPQKRDYAGIHTASSLQIGNISVIAQETGIKTVGNFRARDIAAGGQGAPLVPFADELIFSRNKRRAIQNIGGIANVTVLSPDISTFAFDTGPGNILIDFYMKKFFKKDFDKDGETALKGMVDEKWLNFLLEEPYYKIEPPKTTGRELFNDEYAINALKYAPQNPYHIISTAAALTARTISDAYKKFVFPKTKPEEIVLGGGGAYNKALIKYLKYYLPEAEVKTHNDFCINDKYKEALAFAMLGYCTINGIPNNIPECTGAKCRVVMGEVAY